MKHNKYPQNQTEQTANALRPAPGDTGVPAGTAFTPSPDEVARRAYFTYVNEGSQNGHEVQHWLTAEAQLIAERNLTRVHGFHNKT
jgi:hypothetical protein